MAPGLIFGNSMTGTSGGRMLETLIRLMLPMPAASSALSKALRVVPPSACPAVAAAIVTVFVIRSSSPRVLASNHHAATRAERNLRSLYRADEPTQEKSDATARRRPRAPVALAVPASRAERAREACLGGGASSAPPMKNNEGAVPTAAPAREASGAISTRLSLAGLKPSEGAFFSCNGVERNIQ